MKLTLTIIFLVLAVLVTGSNGWWWSKPKYGCLDPSRGDPYYFGTTDLFCMTKTGKRDAPSRYTKAISHRWILYKGHYFERLSNGDFTTKGHSQESDKCKTHRESTPAGYSSLSVDCIARCTKNYKRKYGSYGWWGNNCHIYANRISEILCNKTTCPSWCA
ncbi:uncharacterized protein LOC134693421 [Mytilus trossulus]|uniref:uncharacterized protein LOC134693421 n=1 Tax=Mytilus trossulus TaxID=6551 RepID=UPI0030044BCA